MSLREPSKTQKIPVSLIVVFVILLLSIASVSYWSYQPTNEVSDTQALIIKQHISAEHQLATELEQLSNILHRVAQRLTDHIRACDSVARMGDDDFVIIISELDRKDEIETIMQRILQPISESFSVDCHMLNINTSVGIAREELTA